jgi:hypothetical protein
MNPGTLKSIFQWKLFALIALSTVVVVNKTNGQPDLKSAFETKVDNYLKLYAANFDITNEKNTNTGKQFTPDKLPSLTWVRKAALKSKATIQDKKGQTTNLKLNFSFYHFDDNRQCKAAMDSMLNCFGKGCVKIQWDVPVQSVHTDPVVIIFNETEIISCQVSCEQENNYWHLFTPDLIKTFSESSSHTLQAGCDGQVTFSGN